LAYFDFLTSGTGGGYNPSLSFDECWYRTAHPDVRSAIASRAFRSGYHHFLCEGARSGYAANPYFLPQWYAAWYPEVAEKLARKEFAHPFEHYLVEGAAGGLSPNLYFEEAWYIQNHPDLKQALARGEIVSGHSHYLEKGMSEGRSCSTVFDSEWYRRAYPAVDEFMQKGLVTGSYDHFCRYGRKAGLSPSAGFNEKWYLDRNPDVRAGIQKGTWVDGLHHFVAEGLIEGRLPRPDATSENSQQNATVNSLARRELLQFLGKRKDLVCEASSTPVVSVLLVLYNRAELTLRCLRSILQWADVPYEIVIVDNASSDETSALLTRVRGAKLIQNQTNLHFLKAANQAADAARGEYLLFVNNDSELQACALSSAAEILAADSSIGAVGGKIILNNGVLQEAGSYFLRNGFSTQFGRGQAPFSSDYMHRRDVPYCSGAFLMTPASLFRKCGKFDPAFLPAYCEDADYCLRLWQMGLRVVFNPDSVIMHHETGISRFRQFLFPPVLRNIAIFRSRYSEYLRTLPDYGAAPISSLDGKHLRLAYLLIVDRIESSVENDALPVLIRRMLEDELFLSVYPLQPWFGERRELKANIPDEVEVVAERGMGQLEEFCKSRSNVYEGVVFLVDFDQTCEDLRAVRSWLPGVRVFSSKDHEYPSCQ